LRTDYRELAASAQAADETADQQLQLNALGQHPLPAMPVMSCIRRAAPILAAVLDQTRTLARQSYHEFAVLAHFAVYADAAAVLRSLFCEVCD
jgi:hypothetical protein